MLLVEIRGYGWRIRRSEFMDWWLIIQILFLFCVVFTLFEITLDIHTDQKYKRRNKLETQEEYWRQQKKEDSK